MAETTRADRNGDVIPSPTSDIGGPDLGRDERDGSW